MDQFTSMDQSCLPYKSINQIYIYLPLYGMVEICFLFESVKNDRIDKKYFLGGGVYWKDTSFKLKMTIFNVWFSNGENWAILFTMTYK